METGETEPREGVEEPDAGDDDETNPDRVREGDGEGEGGEGEGGEDDGGEDPKRRLARLRRLAVRLDSNRGLLTAADHLRRRLPGDDRFGDPLSTAGPQPVEVVARGVSAMQPKRQSVVQELGLAGLQVWQSLSEAAGRGHGDQEMAILFTDLVSFSSWALKTGDAAALHLLREVGTAVERPVLERDGRIIKRLGDGVMATFLEPRNAVDAALDAQEAVAKIDLDGYQPQLRAGLHWGSPRKLGGDYLGVDVNVAARVVEAAKGDQVLVSQVLLSRIDPDGLKTGRAKRLKAEGTPRGLQVARISRQ
jgi:adenylate cyclase